MPTICVVSSLTRNFALAALYNSTFAKTLFHDLHFMLSMSGVCVELQNTLAPSKEGAAERGELPHEFATFLSDTVGKCMKGGSSSMLLIVT